MLTRLTVLVALSLPVLAFAEAHELEGDYLYRVSTVRAAPGSLADLLDWTATVRDADYFEDSGQEPPFLIRHSQGDQWDLMIIMPIESWTAFYSDPATRKRSNAALAHAQLLASKDTMIAFEEDHFAYGPPLSAVKMAYDDNSFFHIEMFAAAPGKGDELLGQRRMENVYLRSTGQTPNMIFRRAAGSDVDVFTIGFHKSLETFAAPASVSDEDKEAAAIEAGFKDRSDLSFYLRSLISSHHDTLAVKVE